MQTGSRAYLDFKYGLMCMMLMGKIKCKIMSRAKVWSGPASGWNENTIFHSSYPMKYVIIVEKTPKVGS